MNSASFARPTPATNRRVAAVQWRGSAQRAGGRRKIDMNGPQQNDNPRELPGGRGVAAVRSTEQSEPRRGATRAP